MIHTLERGRRDHSRRAVVAPIAPIAMVALAIALGACSKSKSSGLPPGFGQGTQWAVPLLGALGEATPLAAVTIDGKGPFLFAVDVHAPSAVDPRLARELGLGPSPGQGEPAEQPAVTGAGAATPTVTVPRITLGNLTVASAQFEVRDVRATHHGRPVQGSIGREILHPTLLWTLDRDRQSLYLGVRARQEPPRGAQRVPLTAGAAEAGLLVEARIAGAAAGAAEGAAEGAPARLRVTFEPVTAIRPELAKQAGLQSVGGRAWMADEVRVGEVSASEILFSPFGQNAMREAAQPAAPPPGMPEAAQVAGRRSRPDHAPPPTPAEVVAEGVDGVLGQRFWSNFLVAMYLAESAMWLAPRAEEQSTLTAERLSRWGALFDGCEHPACVSLAVAQPAPVAPAADEAGGNPDAPAAKPGAGKAGGKNAGKPGKPGKGAKAAEVAPPPPPPNRLVVTREASKKDETYDVLLQALDEVDTPLPAPYVLVAMPKGATEVAFELTTIAPAYERAASFRVVDATPFPPPCRDKQGCVWLQR